MLLSVLAGPVKGERGEQNDDADLEGENCVKHHVHFLHQVADLSGRFLCILHYFRVISNIDNDAIAILSIPESASP